MNASILALGAAIALLAAPAWADSASNANAGLAALERGENSQAIGLFTLALDSGDLTGADREYALVKRGQAHLNLHQTELALADVNNALAINGDDAEAQNLKREITGDAGGPSLPETMRFIADTVTGQGVVNWEGFVHDAATNTDWTYQRGVTINAFAPHPESCILSFHYTMVTNGQNTSDLDGGVALREVQSIRVVPEAQRVGEVDAKGGHPGYTSQFHPDIYVLQVMRTAGAENDFNFYDPDLAARAAKAMQHAVDLCGGGVKSPF